MQAVLVLEMATAQVGMMTRVAGVEGDGGDAGKVYGWFVELLVMTALGRLMVRVGRRVRSLNQSWTRVGWELMSRVGLELNRSWLGTEQESAGN